MKPRPAMSLLAATAALLCAGCRTMPPPPPPPPPGPPLDPAAAAAHVRSVTPERFQLLSTVAFSLRGHGMSGLGAIVLDTVTRTFSVVGMTPLGVKLFDIGYTNGQAVSHYALPAFTAHGGDFAGTVGGDIARVYFDLAPGTNAVAGPHPAGVEFTEPQGRGTLQLVYAAPGVLTEKLYVESGRTAWIIEYRDYREQGGKLYPAFVFLKNRKYHYTLTVRLKEIMD